VNSRTADRLAVATVALVLLAGLLATWQAWQSVQQTSSGMMMDGSMSGGMMSTGPAPIWVFFGTITAVVLVGLGYLLVRETVTERTGARVERSPGQSDDGTAAERPAENPTDAQSPADARPPILDVLPADERRVLEPVVESPGLTQIELRDRSDFSKSKVSQTVSDLEKRGLISRERQGRTYRVYPAGDLDSGDDQSG
jgi:hypothetical protein